jgi:hypothetical protein
MKVEFRNRIYLSALLILLALPLVWFSGTTWNSNSDALLPTLISIENWRFLFWSHSRFGTLVPLIAKPFTDMRSNLLFQNFIHAFSLIIFSYALSRIFFSRDKKVSSRSATYLLFIFLFLVTNLAYLGHLISGLPYAAPLGIFGLCLLLAESKISKKITYPILVILLGISCWINPLNGYYLAPLLLLLLFLKGFKGIRNEILIAYSLVTFGIFFIVLGLANGEISGTVAPNFRPFEVFNWWLSLFIIQVVLVARAVYRREFRINLGSYWGFALTWISIFALTSLRHIYLNLEAPRYFVTATFVSMCLTMRLVEQLLNSSKKYQLAVAKIAGFLRINWLLPIAILLLLISNIFIARNLVSDYPLQQPQKKLLTSLFKNQKQEYKFASGDFWYTWPTKLYVAHPEDIFVTSFETENQYDVSTDSRESIQARFKDGDLGICFGDVKICTSQIKGAAYRAYGAFKVQVQTDQIKKITDDPTTVHSLRVKITSK